MKKLLLVALLILSTASDIFAQQDPQYTQYMYNLNVINPAYVGSKENLAIGLLYRNQWAGLEGAPETITFSISSPVTEKVGLGLSAIKDDLGPVSETNVYGDFSYTLQLAGENRLAFGLKAGVTFFDVSLFSEIGNGFVPDPGDPAFASDVSNIFPNVGAGVFYFTDKYYVGVSVPNFFNAVHLDQNDLNFGSETNHYFATAGYVFELSQNVKLKPSVLVKSAFDAPVSWDANLNALFFEKFEIGASYRLEDSFSGIVGFQVSPSIRVGYAYDAIQSNLNVATGASHEVILNFDLRFAKKSLRSPRYF